MEKIKIRIRKEEMDYAYVDKILYGSTIEVENNFVALANIRLFEVIENKNNIRGYFTVVLTNAYIKDNEIIVDMCLKPRDDRYEELPASTKLYNEAKYKNTNTYEYIKNNHKALMSTAIKTVSGVINNNGELEGILEDKIRYFNSSAEKIYMLDYIKEKYGKMGQEVFNRVTNSHISFRHYNPIYSNGEMELLATFTNYINLHNLNGIIFIDPDQLEYVRGIGEETELGKNKKKNNKEYDLPKDEGEKISVEGGLLAAYCYLDNEAMANNLSARLNLGEELGVGKYIFIVAKSIDKFIKSEMSKIYSGKIPKCFDKSDENCIQNCPLYNKKETLNVTESIIKLIFLHEVGHMAFSNCSRKNKMVVDETAANFFASMCTKSLPEKCMIREMINFQPEEYKYYFPALLTFKPIKFYLAEEEPGYTSYTYETVFRTLKYGLLRAEEYSTLVEKLIRDLYY